MERIWDEVLTQKMSKLYAAYDVAEHPLIMMLRNDTPSEDKEKMMEILFESIGVAAVHLAPSAALAIYGTGSMFPVLLWFQSVVGQCKLEHAGIRGPSLGRWTLVDIFDLRTDSGSEPPPKPRRDGGRSR